MNEGKGILIKIIDNKLEKITKITNEPVIYDDTNLVDMLNVLSTSIDNLSEVSEEIITLITNRHNKKKAFRTSVNQLRDLLIGKRDYKLKVNLTDEHKETYNTFLNLLKEYIEEIQPGLIDSDAQEESCNTLLQQITRKEIINNFEFIEKITEEYNYIDKDNNLVKVMKYVNEHNLNILKTPKKSGPLLNINYIFKPKLDPKLLEILKKFDIEQKDLPNYLLSELKKCDVDSVYETYLTLKRNKAEDYGILHLVKKHNSLAKLVLTLYATPDSIKSVVDSLRNKDNAIDIPLLRVVINNILPAFLIKKNEYFNPKNEDYVKNITKIKNLGVNYKALINRTPLLLIMSNDALELTLTACVNEGAKEKSVINKLYKTLAVNPAIIIENIEVLNNYQIDLKEYFNGKNYNLLKVTNLNKKIKYLERYNNLSTEPLDIEALNKMLVGKVYRESMQDNFKDIWGDR